MSSTPPKVLFVQARLKKVLAAGPANCFDRAVQLSSQIKSEMPTKKLKDFLAALPDENANADVLALRNDVKAFALGFPTVGF